MYCLPLGMATTSSELDRVAHSVVNTVSVHDVQETQARGTAIAVPYPIHWREAVIRVSRKRPLTEDLLSLFFFVTYLTDGSNAAVAPTLSS